MISCDESKFSHFLRGHVKKLQDFHCMLRSKIVLDLQTSECQHQHQVIEHNEFLYHQPPLARTKERNQDDEVTIKATIKNGNQLEENELRITLKASSEENNDPLKEKEQEYFEEGSELKPININSNDDNDLKYAHGEESTLGQHDRSSGGTTANATTVASTKQMQAVIRILNNNNTANTIIQTHYHTVALSKAMRITEGEANLDNGSPAKDSKKDITVDKNLTSDTENEAVMIEETLSGKEEDLVLWKRKKTTSCRHPVIQACCESYKMFIYSTMMDHLITVMCQFVTLKKCQSVSLSTLPNTK